MGSSSYYLWLRAYFGLGCDAYRKWRAHHPSGFDWAASAAVRIRQNIDVYCITVLVDHRYEGTRLPTSTTISR